ncbi:type VI secretion system tip protein VgrG [Sodalis sp. dw_96]|uniref:type VI secretion system Vgr family protein n=1 Tax=Sodalis sp. dw_96 TaxID=2719794 RepID=UPI001BD61966|nr:type VI secretion system tip protein VgrG [Sodalis sp. dw_96]
MLNAVDSLLFDHSQHKLHVWDNSSPLVVLAFTGEEHLSRPFCYRIEFTSPAKDIPPTRMLMQDASFTLNAPPVTLPAFGLPAAPTVPLRSVHGVVAGFKRLAASRDESRYEVTLVPRLALLKNSLQHRIYQHLSVPEIVEKVLRDRHGFKGQDFLFTLAHSYPKREQVMQYGEDDLTFISRLLAEVGIWFRFTADSRLNIDVVEMYDDQRHYQSGTLLPLRNPSGLDSGGVSCVWALQTAHQVVEGRVSARDYNYRDASASMDGEADVARGDKTTYGESYHYAINYLAIGDKYAQDPEPESGMFYARLRHERYLNRQTELKGFTSSASLAPGQELKVQGEDAPRIFQDGAVITGIRSRAARDRSLEVAFTAIPYSEIVCFRPEPTAKPMMAGTLPARVTSTRLNDTYSHIDNDGRYRVSFNFDRDEWQPGAESLWLRQARSYAGDTYGLHMPLLAGTEVAIAFEQGNPDKPYIAYALHDSKHPDLVTLQNYKRNVLRTPANNKLRLDDTKNQEHIKLSTEYGGKTQLNLGHLVDSRKQPRGEGFELRTDLHGSIRAAKGIFISADAQPKANGDQLDMQAAIEQLDKALSIVKSLSQASELAQAELAEESGQQRLTSALHQLAEAGLVIHAPYGAAVLSPENVQLSSGQGSVSLTAGKNADISVLKTFTVAAGGAISMFAKNSGMKLFANRGKVNIQAQNDALSVLAKQNVEITSQEGKVQITAQNEIVLNCGGAYIRMKGGNIELGCPNNILLKSTSVQKMNPASYSASAVMLPSGFSEFFIAHDETTGEVLANKRYRITTAEGKIFEGVTDTEGKTMEISTSSPEKIDIEFS